MRKGKRFTACVLALALTACGKAPAPDTTETADQAATTQDAQHTDAVASDITAANGAAAAVGSGLLDKAGNPIALLPFDIDSVPVSAQALGSLPFFSLPSGYAPANRPMQRAYARFPFHLGDGLHWVEGSTWSARIGVDSSGARDKEYSTLELQRNLEAVLGQAGAKRVYEGPLRRDFYYGELQSEIGGGFIDAVNLDDKRPTQVFVIRQADRNVWVQVSYGPYDAGLVVVEERPFQASARWTGEFPYLAMPKDYAQRNHPSKRDFDAFPFWTGQAFEMVEGRTYALDFGKDEKRYSLHEVRRNLEAMMAEAGGRKLFAGRIPREQSDSVAREVKSAYSHAATFSWDEYDSEVYRVDLPNGKQVWVYARLDYLSAGWVVAEREGFLQTAALLPAQALKQRLDADGRVAIQVNFAVDKADILPESQPQLDQVLALLQQDPALDLSIEGHTDDTGAAAHNRKLSEARAQAVVAALAARGVAASRLASAGFGPDRPVADNASEQGRAKNRRVELVRRG